MEDSGIESDFKSAGLVEIKTAMPNISLDLPSVHTSLKPESIKSASTEISDEEIDTSNKTASGISSKAENINTYGETRTKSETIQLHKRLIRQIQQARKSRQNGSNSVIDNQPKKPFISYKRLNVPNKPPQGILRADSQPLVTWDSESDMDEFEFHPLSKESEQEITQQLIKDGFNLDLAPDDEDLDLIPPKPIRQNCECCQPNFSCGLL